ncbi:hypothetical protein ACFS5L_16705 [Streptomyces phyllanthi]|uniref:LPXTG cell wall anchor domain-containing protein n=1 Tax=Streptomyces phyllanthi TaxID=1803180 RepID=A0A5N8VYH1_9ACTN|nr:hypothetical protein [Streptomyces phyllanthi]MPY39736.1 hypothetical protein [Streptomyces phyllanthi]
MRTTQPLLRSGLTLAAAAALPLALAVPADAQTGISVSTTGSTVTVTTSACPTMNASGSFGQASLLASGQSSFAQGRQALLSGTSDLQSAAWANVSPGTYTVIVTCQNGTTAGTQSVIVSARPTISATATPTRRVSPSPSPSPSPTRGVMGGLGGATKEYGTLTLVGGGVLVVSGLGATIWYLRRRAKPHRL